MHERFPEAISYLELATMLGASPTVWHLLAHSYELSGDVDEALNIWTMLEPAEPDSNVPGIQIERILSGGPASKGPEMARHAREERLKERKKPGS